MEQNLVSLGLKARLKNRLFWNKTKTWQLLVCVVVGFVIGGVVFLWRDFPSGKNYFRIELADPSANSPAELRDLIQVKLGEKYSVCQVTDGKVMLFGFETSGLAMREVFLRQRLAVWDYWQIKWRLRELTQLQLVLPPNQEGDYDDDYCDRLLEQEMSELMENEIDDELGQQEKVEDAKGEM